MVFLRMKMEFLVAVVFCAGLVHSHPLGGDSSSFLDLGDDKFGSAVLAAAAKDGGYDNDGSSWESTLRELSHGSAEFGDVSRLKRQFGNGGGGGGSRRWNSLDVPDPFLNPIHLQNWGSQFGRNYRAFDGGAHQSTGRLRPAVSSGGLYAGVGGGGGGGGGLFGEDVFQDWKALYRNNRI